MCEQVHGLNDSSTALRPYFTCYRRQLWQTILRKFVQLCSLPGPGSPKVPRTCHSSTRLLAHVKEVCEKKKIVPTPPGLACKQSWPVELGVGKRLWRSAMAGAAGAALSLVVEAACPSCVSAETRITSHDSASPQTRRVDTGGGGGTRPSEHASITHTGMLSLV